MSTSTTTAELATQPASGLLEAVLRPLRQLAASSLLRSSGLSIFDQAVVSGTSLVTSVILGRNAPREELGVYYLALSIVFFVRGIQEQLIAAPYIVYSGRKRPEELAEYAGSTLLHECGVLVITAAVLGMVAVAGLAPGDVVPALVMLIVAAPLLFAREFVRKMSFAHLHLGRAIVVDVVACGLQLAGLAALAATGRLTVVATLATLAIAAALPTIGWFASTKQPMVGGWFAAVRDWRHNWPFARWALASQLLASTTPYLMPWVVAVTHGAADTGMLGACTTLVGISNTFLMGMCNVLTPRAARAFAHGGLVELRSVLCRMAALFAVVLGPLTLAAFVWGEWLAVTVYGSQFAGAGTIIGVLSLSVLVNSFGVTAGNGLYAMERPSANFAADICSLVSVMVATLVFVPLLGPLGAALSTLAGTLADALSRLWMLRRTMAGLTQQEVRE